jgi:flagellar biosynthesis GTPase FlhF
MELKRILARDSRSANEKAIQLYGKDVLIISSQRLDNQTELIVAVDLNAAAPAPVAQVAAAPTSARLKPEIATTPGALAAGEAPDETADEMAFVPFSKLFQSASAFAPLPSDDFSIEPALPTVSAAVLASAPARDAVAQQARHDQLRNQEIVDMMRLEMAALRKEFSLSRQMMPWQDGLRLSPAVQQLSAAMSEAGVPAGLRALLTDSIQDMTSEQEALPVMHGLLVNAMSRPAMAIPSLGVHAVCGPSGAGKTLMVGRLALAAAQAHGAENQVMVSFADQRPGAWAQMQLLAAQSGVACYRATDSDMLRMLLEDLGGKSVWIDTCGTNFLAQAQLLLAQHPKVLCHAVLPVDATVTSVQKILQNPSLSWASLMLSKVDEAAYPWALVKGLTEQALPVSCMADDNRIGQALLAFDADRLVQLALAPLSATAWAPILVDQPQSESLKPLTHKDMQDAPEPAAPAKKSVRRPRAHKALAPETGAGRAPFDLTSPQSFPVQEDILIPTLLGSVPASLGRNKVAKSASALKVAHG